ncbi:hypothetical protein MC885_002283 [Smutsia gigantea]|nr:hypothetical protein MC885_002283 [Smutsia gigantea]
MGCHWDSEEPSLSPRLGGVPRYPGPAGLAQSFLCDPRLGTHSLWSGTDEWLWLQEEAVSSTNLEGVCWSHMVGLATSPRFGLQGPWNSGRRQPSVSVWGEPGLSPACVLLGKSLPSPDRGARGLDFPTQLAGQGAVHSFGDPTVPGLHREEAAQAPALRLPEGPGVWGPPPFSWASDLGDEGTQVDGHAGGHFCCLGLALSLDVSCSGTILIGSWHHQG